MRGKSFLASLVDDMVEVYREERLTLAICAGAFLIVPAYMNWTLREHQERQAQIEEGIARDISAWDAVTPPLGPPKGNAMSRVLQNYPLVGKAGKSDLTRDLEDDRDRLKQQVNSLLQIQRGQQQEIEGLKRALDKRDAEIMALKAQVVAEKALADALYENKDGSWRAYRKARRL